MPLVSITMPTLFPELSAEAIDRIRKTCAGHDYEIVVCSPNEVTGDRIKWVRDEGPKGSVPAQRRCFEAASGTFVAVSVDDWRFVDGWLDSVLTWFRARETQTYVFGLSNHAGVSGTCFGRSYPYFPFARRSTLERLGGLFTEEYTAHFGDPDLGMRVWNAPDGVLEIAPFACKWQIEDRKGLAEAEHKFGGSLQKDLDAFVGKWGSSFGKGWKTCHLRDFNLEVPWFIFDQAKLKGQEAICAPDPAFGKQLRNAYRAGGPAAVAYLQGCCED